MQQFFGPVSPAFIAVLVTILTNLAKKKWNLEGLRALGAALLISIPAAPYHIVTSLLMLEELGVEPSALMYVNLGMESFWYYLATGALAAGFYSATKASQE